MTAYFTASIVGKKHYLKNYHRIIDDFINYVQGTDNMRFTFFITSKIARYLSQISRKNRSN